MSITLPCQRRGVAPRLRLAALLLAVANVAGCAGDEPRVDAEACTVRAVAQLDRELRESSGVAASRTHEGVVWTHNDSGGEPVLYALGLDGAIQARLRLANGRNIDWEDIATGPCPPGLPGSTSASCIYAAEIGDNSGSRDDIGAYIVPEPDALVDATVSARFQALRFPDSPRDAESLFVTEEARIHVITKGRGAPIQMFRTEPLDSTSAVLTLEPVHQFTRSAMQMPDFVTAAAISSDGLILVRSYGFLDAYRLRGDNLRRAMDASIDLRPLGEPQGEGVAMLEDGSIVLTSEEGPQSVAARLTHLDCSLPGP